MATEKHTPSTNSSRNSSKSPGPDHKGGNSTANAKKWGGGSAASKGGVSKSDKQNPNSSAKS